MHGFIDASTHSCVPKCNPFLPAWNPHIIPIMPREQSCEIDLHDISANPAAPELIPLLQLCWKSRSNPGGDHSSCCPGLWEGPGKPLTPWTWRGEARTRALHQYPPWDKPLGDRTGSRRSLLWCHIPLSCSEKGEKHSLITENVARSSFLLQEIVQIPSQSITGKLSQSSYPTCQGKYQKQMKVDFWPLKKDVWHSPILVHPKPHQAGLNQPLCPAGGL